MKDIKVIAFDADDTLWVNEPLFQQAERTFCSYFNGSITEAQTSSELFKTEMSNLAHYGYGVKSFVLSMIETSLRITDKSVSPDVIEEIIGLGKELLHAPVQLLDHVEYVLQSLYGKYLLVVATKGDLLDQERKLSRSGLANYFHLIIFCF